MAKMGYKPGSSLGKSGNEGLKEPIKMEIKADRKGLGHVTEAKRKASELLDMHILTEEKRQKMTADYRTQKRDLSIRKRLIGDFRKSQKVCYELDARIGICIPAAGFFWPDYGQLEGEEETASSTGNNKKVSQFSSRKNARFFYEALRARMREIYQSASRENEGFFSSASRKNAKVLIKISA